MMNAYPARFTRPEIWAHIVRIVGTGATDPTKQVGDGIAVTRTAEGVYRLTWSENPGTFQALVANFGASSPGDVPGHSCVRDDYIAASYAMDVRVFDAADTADDLEADEYLDLIIYFTQASV